MYITNIDEIIQKGSDDILNIISTHVTLKNCGGDTYSGCCPFHKEKTPSFKVNTSRQTFYCFGCHEKGGVVGFIMAINNIDFLGAIQELAVITGVQCQYAQSDDSTATTNPWANTQELINLCTQAAIHYHNNLLANPEAMKYCLERGLNKHIVNKYQIGFADNKKIKEIETDKEKLISAGLLQRSKEHNGTYDPVANRIVIPLHTPAGRIIGFTGRYIGDRDKKVKNKYINTPTTSIFKKSEVIFGYHHAKKIIMNSKGSAYPIIIEGQIKAIACLEAGYACVAPGGTALTEKQVRLLTTLAKGKTIGIIPDNDTAGKTACVKHISKLINEINNIYILNLVIPPKFKDLAKVDPDDLLADGYTISFTATHPVEWIYTNVVKAKKDTTEWAGEILEYIINPIISACNNKTIKYAYIKQLEKISGIPQNWLATEKLPPAKKETINKIQRIDTTITHVAMLCAIILQLEIIEETPNLWQQYINWTELPVSLASALIKIGKLRNSCTERGINIQNAISISNIPPHQKELLQHWSLIKLPDVELGKLIRDTQKIIITDEQIKTQNQGIK
jgi:DNA primase